MRRLRHRVVIAIGLLVAGTAAAQTQPVDGRHGRHPQMEQRSFLPGFRMPPELQRHLDRSRQSEAPTRQQQVRQQLVRRQAPSRTSRQAVRTQQASTVHHANVAKSETPTPGRFRASALVAEARRYLGTNPTTMARLWCARFMNFVLKRVGQPGTGSDAAKSFAFYGRRISGPQYGAIAVMTRKGGGHVGIVTGVDRNGNPIVIAGNNGRRQVGISVYPKRRVIAYVMPDGRAPGNSRYASTRPSRTR